MWIAAGSERFHVLDNPGNMEMILVLAGYCAWLLGMLFKIAFRISFLSQRIVLGEAIWIIDTNYWLTVEIFFNKIV